MKIIEKQEGDVVVLLVIGALNSKQELGVIDEKINQITEKNIKKIVLELSSISDINKTGLGELMSCAETIKDKKGRLKLAKISPPVETLIRSADLLDYFELTSSAELAIEEFKTNQ